MSRKRTFGAAPTQAVATGLAGALALLVYLTLVAIPAGAAGGTYTVTSTGDHGDTGINGECRANTTPVSCTLRAALQEANADGGPSTINFNIPGDGPHTIASFTSTRGDLPYLDEGGTTINGYSQPGAAPNTDPLVSNAVLKIQLEGPSDGGQSLLIRSAGNAVRGLAIYGGRQDVRIADVNDLDAHDNVLAGNFLGTNAAGTFRQTTRNNSVYFGIVVRSASKRNVIGGPNPADRNVISGHGGRAVLIGVPGTTLDPGTDENVVQNNLIGLAPNGLAALPNLGHAVDVNNGAARNRVVGNVVSGNGEFSEGIEISHGVSTRGNEIIDNKVGTNPEGTAAPAYTRNGSQGIRVEDGADETVVRGNIVGGNGGGGIQLNSLSKPATRTRVENNFVGVTPGGTAIPNGAFGIHIGLGEGTPDPAGSTDAVITGNQIAYNPVGIQVDGNESVRNRITANSIHDNAGLGIDIAPLGMVNQNDVGDGDTGPNTRLNWPVLTGATALTVSGTACASCTVEVFQADGSATLDGALQTSYGEGKTLLSTTTAGPDGSFVAALPPSGPGRIVTATATDTAGNTSEFGRNIAVPGSNASPKAAFTASCPDLACSFDAAPTTDPDGDAITSYTWAFGDGGSATGATPSHTYAAAGTYRVTLTVQDARGGSGTTTSSLFVSTDARLARDGFSRTVASGWGSAETGGAWTGAAGDTGLSVDGSAGVARVDSGGSREVDLNGVSTLQADASVTVTTSRAPLGGDHVAAIVARSQSATLMYRGRVRIAADGTVHAGAEAGGTLLAEQVVPGLTAPPGTALRLRVRVTGSNPTAIGVKVWRADAAEPAAWSLTTSDSTAGLQQAGVVGVRAASTETLAGTVAFSFDDLDVVAPPPPSTK